MKVFVSHSSADKVIVRQLVASMSERGHELWFDEASLPFGDHIKREIRERISSTDVFLLIYSAAASASEWVSFEIDAFLALRHAGLRARLVPVLLDATALPAPLRDVKYITSPDSYVQLAASVLVALEGQTWNAVLLTRDECKSEVVHIPRGWAKVGRANRRERIDHDYLIDKYPVSRRKFMSFCYRGGYSDLNNYSSRARSFMQDCRSNLLALQPSDLLAARFPLDLDRLDWLDFPICRISAYEAEAYCRWVGGRLPRNAEWDKAARDDSGAAYPWGDVLEENRCFTGKPECSDYFLRFKVYDYPEGQSPYGVFNMAGLKEEYIGQLFHPEPNDWDDEVLTRGWLDNVGGSNQVPRCSLLLEAGCYPVAGEAHPITFRTVYPLDSTYDALMR